MDFHQELKDMGFYTIVTQSETGPEYHFGDKGDMSVGIEPLELTPYFQSEAELKEYIQSRRGHEEIRHILIDVYGESEVLEWGL